MTCLVRVLVVAMLAACGPRMMWSGRTLDRRHSVEVIEDGGLQYVVIDGERRAAYHGIAGSSIVFAEPSHLAFAARLGSSWVVVHDGRTSEPWDGIGALVMSPAGKLAYAAQRRNAWHVVVNGIVGPPFHSIASGTIQFSRQGERLAYVAEQDGRFRVVVDGMPGGVFDGIGELTFAANGARFAYAARRALDAFVVVDHSPSRAWSAVSNVQLASTGEHVAYAASDDGVWRVVVDDEPGPAVDSVRRIIFSDDGAHHAWVARVAGHDVLAIDDRPIVAVPKLRADAVTFRPSSTSAGPGLTYIEPIEPRGQRIAVDEVGGPVYDEVGPPVWSAAGQLAYAARRDRSWLVVRDGQELPGGSHVGDPVFSRDGKRLGYVARRGNATLAIIDGRQHRFDLAFEDSLVFSADGRRWALVAGDLARERLFISIDGRTKISLPPSDIYSAVARGETENFLRAWAQIEVDRK